MPDGIDPNGKLQFSMRALFGLTTWFAIVVFLMSDPYGSPLRAWLGLLFAGFTGGIFIGHIRGNVELGVAGVTGVIFSIASVGIVFWIIMMLTHR
jgi:hypothetical protein